MEAALLFLVSTHLLLSVLYKKKIERERETLSGYCASWSCLWMRCALCPGGDNILLRRIHIIAYWFSCCQQSYKFPPHHGLFLAAVTGDSILAKSHYMLMWTGPCVRVYLCFAFSLCSTLPSEVSQQAAAHSHANSSWQVLASVTKGGRQLVIYLTSMLEFGQRLWSSFYPYLYSRAWSFSLSAWLVEFMFRLRITFHQNPALALK